MRYSLRLWRVQGFIQKYGIGLLHLFANFTVRGNFLQKILLDAKLYEDPIP